MAAWAQRVDITLADKRQRRAVTVQSTAKSLTAMGITTLDGCLAAWAQRADITLADKRQRRAVTVQSTAKSLTAMGITTLDGCLGPAGRHNVSRQAPASGCDRTNDSQIVDRDGNSNSRWLLGPSGPT
jgi:hypothetical protein